MTTTDPPPHSFHRKIDVQSPMDLQYLRENISRSAQQKLDLHFPPLLQGQQSSDAYSTEDPMRTAVSNLVSHFIKQTFTSAAHGISINGLDATALPDQNSSTSRQIEPEQAIEYAPYDPRLTSKLSSLYAELESLTTQVAKLRREAPEKSAETYRQTLENVVAEEEERFKKDIDISYNLPSSTTVSGKQTSQGEDPDTMDIDASTSTTNPIPSLPLNLTSVSPEIQLDIQTMYTHGLDELAALTCNTTTPIPTTDIKPSTMADLSTSRQDTKSLTRTMGLVERAGGVVRELE
ncbi:putative kinetochore protein [Phaeomoniella chlamydospora]|uniref:Putative kinetochore protein n=1 Tax=Phaeomoniella chlamydospora TaxID=158046 RepID=A0A0G2GEC4_PHACM|nr:putative kinetochore protein [Phaeomoniella chlamydospora]